MFKHLWTKKPRCSERNYDDTHLISRVIPRLDHWKQHLFFFKCRWVPLYHAAPEQTSCSIYKTNKCWRETSRNRMYVSAPPLPHFNGVGEEGTACSTKQTSVGGKLFATFAALTARLRSPFNSGCEIPHHFALVHIHGSLDRDNPILWIPIGTLYTGRYGRSWSLE